MRRTLTAVLLAAALPLGLSACVLPFGGEDEPGSSQTEEDGGDGQDEGDDGDDGQDGGDDGEDDDGGEDDDS